jgi:hypothetical protein
MGKVLTKQREQRFTDIKVERIRLVGYTPRWRHWTGCATAMDTEFLQHGFDARGTGRCFLLVCLSVYGRRIAP